MYATIETRYDTIIVERAGSVVYLTMDRPEARNAMNQRMVEEIRDFFLLIRDDRSIRAVILRGTGETFCAGADIKEMRDPAYQSPEAQLRYAEALDEMLCVVQNAPQVTVAVVEGAAIGGGLGLVCVTDVAIAHEDARFALPEVRLGIAPAVISPFVLQRIGLTKARELALTGRRLDGHGAMASGLVHTVARDDELDRVVEAYVRNILKGSPEALAATKALLLRVSDRLLSESRADRVETLNRLRHSDDGHEGMAAFVEKRLPAWVPQEEEYSA